MKTRMIRRGKEDLENFLLLTEALKSPSAKNRNEALCNFGNLLSKSDKYALIPHKDELLECSYEIFKSVWGEASGLRRSGKRLGFGRGIM